MSDEIEWTVLPDGSKIVQDPDTGAYFLSKIESHPDGSITIMSKPITEQNALEKIQMMQELTDPDVPYESPPQLFIDGQGDTGTPPLPENESVQGGPGQGQDTGQGLDTGDAGGTGEGTPGHGQSTEDGFDPATGNKIGGDPIILFSGQFYHQVLDLEVKGRGLYFSFKRTYLNQTLYKGPLGYNWDHNYNLWLREEQWIQPDGTLQNIIYRSTGQLREDPYIQILDAPVSDLAPLSDFPDAVFQPPPGFFERLEKSGGIYILETDTGVKLEYNNDLYIERIIDPYGNEMKFEYQDGLLRTIRDPVGKEFEFLYDEMNRILTLEDKTGNRSVRYHYGDNGDLEEVDLILKPDLVTGTDYRYLGPNYPFRLQHNLTEIIRFTGESILETEYGLSDGTPEFNKVIRQRSADGEYSYEYGPIYNSSVDPTADAINVPLSFTRVFYPNDHSIEYWFNNQGCAVRKSEYVLVGGSSIAAELVTTYRYNEDAMILKEVIPGGATTEYYYQRELYSDLHNGNFSGATPQERLTFGNLLKKIERPRIAVDENRCIVTEYTYYNDLNRLKSIRGPFYAEPILLEPILGHTIGGINYEYDKGNLKKISYPDVELPDGTVQSLDSAVFIYDGNGSITDIIVGILHTRYTYFPDILRSGFVREIVEDPDGIERRTLYQVDEIGRITQIRDHYGSVIDIEWTAFDTPKITKLPETAPGNTRPTIIYRYDKNRQLIQMIEEVQLHDGTMHPEGSLTQTFTYDPYGRLKKRSIGSTINPDKRKWQSIFTPFNLPKKEIDPMGNVTHFKYNERMLVSSVTRGLNTDDETTRRILYNESGSPIKIIDGRKFESVIEYDGFGRPKMFRDASGNEMSMDYDASGNIIRSIVSGSHPQLGQNVKWSDVEFHYDAVGRTIAKIDHLFTPGSAGADKLIETLYFYDTINRLQTINGPATLKWIYQYDALNRLSSSKDANGNEIQWLYDDSLRTVTIIEKEMGNDESGNLVTQIFRRVVKFNSRGLPVEEIDGLQNITGMGVDSRNLLTHIIKVNHQEFFTDYNIFGQPVKEVTRVNGHQVITKLKYDDCGRLVRAVSPVSGTTNWTYDTVGRVYSIEHNGGTTIYEYDKESNIERETDGNGIVIRRFYTPGGVLRREESDVSGFMLVPNAPNYTPISASAIEFKCTPLGSISVASNQSATLKLHYDSLERIIKEELDGRSLNYEYDDADNRIGLTLPGGRTIRYEYSIAGNLIGINQDSAGLDYPGDSSLPASRPLVQIWKVGNRPLTIKFSNFMCKLNYDPDKNILSVNWLSIPDRIPILAERNLYGPQNHLRVHQVDNKLRLFYYDELERLIKTSEYKDIPVLDTTSLNAASSELDLDSVGSQEKIDAFITLIENQVINLPQQFSSIYSLDDNENRLKTSIKESPSTLFATSIYVPDNQDKYISVDGLPFIYDRVGNLLDDGINRYYYNPYNRLAKVDTPLGNLKIVYDGIGRRIRTEDPDKIEDLVYAGPQIVEWLSNGTSEGQIVPLELPNQYAHLAVRGTDAAPIFDTMGSVLGWVRFDGTFKGRTFYDPFGKILEQEDGSFASVGFAGYWYNRILGIYQLLARDYSAQLGRFLQKDPLGLADGFNLYAYSHHAPGTLMDYWGFTSNTADAGWDPQYSKGPKTVRKLINIIAPIAASAAPVTEGIIWNPTVAGRISKARKIAIETRRGVILEIPAGNNKFQGGLGRLKQYADVATDTHVIQIKSTSVTDPRKVAQIARNATRDAGKFIERNADHAGKSPQAHIIVRTGTKKGIVQAAEGALSRARKPIPNSSAPRVTKGIPGLAGSAIKLLTVAGGAYSAYSLYGDYEKGDIATGIGDASGVASSGLTLAAGAVGSTGLATAGAVTGVFAVGYGTGAALSEYVIPDKWQVAYGGAIVRGLKWVGINLEE